MPAGSGSRDTPPPGEQRLHLRGRADHPAIVGVVERLDAEGIAGEPEDALALVPKREGEHAAQAREGSLAVAGEELN